VSADWPSVLAVRPDDLERQVRHFIDHGYEPTTFRDAVLGSHDGRCMAVTFDDAYLSVYERAFPVLERLGAPATVFAPSDKIDPSEPMSWPGIDEWLDGEWRSELRSTSWEQLRELADSGWEIGSHTRTHPHLTELDDASLADELSGSRRECEERSGSECVTIAYPYGDFDDRVVAASGDAGYLAAACLASGASRGRSASLRRPRVAVYRDDGRRRVLAKTWLLTRHPRVWDALLAARD
jgi:peptidoglycan/xylan/chitin deacetylase (PgdA/CDA1 family)